MKWKGRGQLFCNFVAENSQGSLTEPRLFFCHGLGATEADPEKGSWRSIERWIAGYPWIPICTCIFHTTHTTSIWHESTTHEGRQGQKGRKHQAEGTVLFTARCSFCKAWWCPGMDIRITWEHEDRIKTLEEGGRFQFSPGIPHKFWCKVWE